MGKRIKQVWMEEQATSRREKASSSFLPIKPFARSKKEEATMIGERSTSPSAERRLTLLEGLARVKKFFSSKTSWNRLFLK